MGRVSITVSFFLFYGLILYLAMREKDKLSVLGALAVMALSLVMEFVNLRILCFDGWKGEGWLAMRLGILEMMALLMVFFSMILRCFLRRGQRGYSLYGIAVVIAGAAVYLMEVLGA